MKEAYLDDVKSLVNRGLGVEGETSINFGGNLSGDDVKDFPAELNEETVEGSIDLLIDSLALWNV
jgi:hypothetical protein